MQMRSLTLITCKSISTDATPKKQRALAAALMAGALCIASGFGAPGIAFAQTALHLSGDVAPGTGGLLFGAFGKPSVNASGDIAFKATITGSSAGFIHSGGTTTAIVLSGDPIVGMPTAEVRSPFSEFSINSSGEVAFSGDWVDPGVAAGEGVFIYSGGFIHAVALNGALLRLRTFWISGVAVATH